MKRALLLAGASLLLTWNSFAQTAVGGGRKSDSEETRGEAKTFKMKLGGGKDKQVRIFMYNSHVQVLGHSGDDVIIEGRGTAAAGDAARAEGLKPLYNTLEDNTGMGLSAVKENNTLTITKASRAGGRYIIRVPKNASVQYKETNWTGGNLTMADLDGEIEVKLNNASATLNNVSGPVVANTTNGTLDVKFSSLDQSKPNAISTVNGKIDITLPANTKANFKLKSLMGEIYTDFDMNLKKEAKSDLPMIGGGNNIDGKTNGGGVEMSIQTINSDIFIRKKK
ncbi:DUF4097 family beta strand repeat-containing protein [Rufibacter sp. LB8]|uniref:DUF4097 family beta strand repeat-containing protein n=1 Tax=Rufibacter sp. LB8 TaxID=2777781 RepID=UPI00178C3118|nr:DUF4097 family beta strand repeat-containing protein [Rufibacter sp. LB8]